MPSRREKTVSLLVMGVLVVVTVGVGVKQASFNPAVREYLKAAADSGVVEVAGDKGKGSRELKSLIAFPSGLSPMSAPERFDRGTLSDKINGRAELYLPAGFVSLKSQRVKFTDGSSGWLELYIYDMGTPRGAFSVYSTQRREGAPDAGFARHGYRTANSVCLVRGREYVEVIASETGSRIDSVLDGIGRTLMAKEKKGSADEGLMEAGLFPRDNLIDGSVALTAANAFGFGSFDNVFTARYREDGATVTLFLSRRASAEEAANLAASYRKFLSRLGGEVREAGGVPGSWMLDLDGSFEGVFTSGAILAGVHEAESPEAVIGWMTRLERAVKKGAR